MRERPTVARAFDEELAPYHQELARKAAAAAATVAER
jgi:hypothetical protein